MNTTKSALTKRMKELAQDFTRSVGRLIPRFSNELAFILESKDNIPQLSACSELIKASASQKEEAAIRFVLLVIYVLNSMNKDESKILWCSYFILGDNHWWAKLYSKSGYYCLRSCAILHFVTLIDSVTL